MRALLAALALLAGAPAFAQTAAEAARAIPRTPDGKPDLQGYWSSDFITPLERPDGFTDARRPARHRPPRR